jgi:hypothetical protein
LFQSGPRSVELSFHLVALGFHFRHIEPRDELSLTDDVALIYG